VTTVPIPASHADLLTGTACGVLTTLTADGHPRSSVVWVDLDGDCACVNTTLERWKGRDMLADPRVSLVVVDPEDTSRFLQIRGEVELITEGAEAHIDELTRRCTGQRRYYGGIYPVARRDEETRVIARIHARRITLDAIHR